MRSDFDVVALDADDTLWHNERLFHGTQERFRALLARYHEPAWIDRRLLETERRNLEHFGYGVKGFILSMIETAVELTEGRVSGREIQQVVDLGREMLRAPVELLEGSEKDPRTYSAVMRRHGVEPARFVMVGNSLRSDVLPVLEAGAAAVHIPYPLTWAHEEVPDEALRDREFIRLGRPLS